MRRSEQPRSLSHSHIRPSYATGPFGYPTLMHIARSSSPRSSLRAPRATSPTFPWLSRALESGAPRMMLIFEGHRENGPATHAAAHAFRARGQQPTRAAKAARIRGAGACTAGLCERSSLRSFCGYARCRWRVRAEEEIWCHVLRANPTNCQKRISPPPKRFPPNGQRQRSKQRDADAPEFCQSAEYAV